MNTFVHFPYSPFLASSRHLSVFFLRVCSFKNSTYKFAHMVFVFFWLISLHLMPLGLIHIVTNGRSFWFSMAEKCSTVCVHVSVYVTFCLFIHDEHLHCFHVLTIVNNASVNMDVQFGLQHGDFIFFRYIPKTRIFG